MTRAFSLVMMLALMTLTVHGQLRICGSCGREDTAGGANCEYCDAALPKVESREPKPADKETVEKAASSDLDFFEAVRIDVLAARQEESRRPAVAMALYQNARALLAAADHTKLPPATAKTVLEGLQRCRGALAVRGQTCPACGGTGREQIILQELAGGTDTTASTRPTGAACPACNGRGTVTGSRDVESTRLLILQGRREAGVLQQAAGRVAAGQAWIPAAWRHKLKPRTMAAIRKTVASKCPDCAGLGLEACKKCEGRGWHPCPNKDCRHGWVEVTPSNVLSPKTALKRRVKCPVCHGTSKVACPTCHGKGSQACKHCKGSGLARPCRKCGGEGVVVCTNCRKKRRTTDTTEVCPLCQGTEWMLCGRCNGDGYLAK